MVVCNPKATPLHVDLNLSLLDYPDEVNAELQSQYRELIGSLMSLYWWMRPAWLCSMFLAQILTQIWCETLHTSKEHA